LLRFMFDTSCMVSIISRVYDALIAACAKKAKVDVLLTFNERHFRQFEGDGLSIEVPSAAP
jgi:predicted nucleic acid-binding protein